MGRGFALNLKAKRQATNPSKQMQIKLTAQKKHKREVEKILRLIVLA